MNFYNFSQSNPSGYYSDGMPKELYIQAATPELANYIAETYGVYFDGQLNGLDCECCNDRWYRAEKWNVVEAKDLPTDLEDGKILIHYATDLNKALA
jgi:hypothetical protein